MKLADDAIDKELNEWEKKLDQLEDLAYNGEPMPEGLNFVDTLYFQKLRLLYAYARQVQMPPEQGKREKQMIVEQYILDEVNHLAMVQGGERWNAIKAAANNVRSCGKPLPDEVLQLLAAIEGKDT